MANTVALTKTIGADNRTVTVADSTVYSNPVRANCGVFLSVQKVDYRGGETLVVSTPNDADPDNTASWSFNLDFDGHYRFKYASVPDYNAGTTYAKYQAAYDSINNVVYVSKSSGNIGNALSNQTFWDLIEDPTELVDTKGTTTEATNCDLAGINAIFYQLTKEKRDQKALDASLESMSDFNRDKDVSDFDLLDLFTEALVYSEGASQFQVGEKIARRAESL